MNGLRKSWPAEIFDQLYARDADPWRFTTSDYEREKYQATIAALGGRRFRSGLEVGCSIGVLTRSLAAHCDRVLGIDFAAAALARARKTCAGLPHVSFRQAGIPRDFPRGEFDLIVLSEVLYFLDAQDIRITAHLAAASLAQDGVVMLVNYLGPTNSPCDGDEAAEVFIAACAPALIPASQGRRSAYRLDVLRPRTCPPPAP